MTRIVAVSGGVDSVVLLDILARSGDQLIVAHVDHGIRTESSQADARFVQALAVRYQVPSVSIRLALGADASEETARAARYGFLYAQAKQYDADIVTAHHRDDLLGSIAINLQRGTGWRGVAVLNRDGITRPLLGWTKQQLYDYAAKHRLEWVEDDSNNSSHYLRNRLRPALTRLDTSVAEKLVALRNQQVNLAAAIDRHVVFMSEAFGEKRYPFIMIEADVAIELLRYRHAMTRPQARTLLQAIKTARGNNSIDIGDGWWAKMTRDTFVVERRS